MDADNEATLPPRPLEVLIKELIFASEIYTKFKQTVSIGHTYLNGAELSLIVQKLQENK